MNIENIDYYIFYNNYKLCKGNNNNERNFKDILIMWRERLLHYCEGVKSIKSILEPRNYLFSTLKAKNNNYDDKVWADVMFMKYARKN